MLRILTTASLLIAALSAVAAEPVARASDPDKIGRGRYVALIGSCNDCHTKGFAASGGKVPDSEWLTGSDLGFSGAWGTTYPSNLRTKLGAMDLATWKAYARALNTRPPMPYWALNEMSEADLEALWTFVNSLGPAGDAAPTALPPGREPSGPAVRFPMPPPESGGKH
jgi:mono/diheme cytochrome c family protein